jgi:hypothetical protein
VQRISRVLVAHVTNLTPPGSDDPKKRGGGYEYKLVAVDVAAANGDEHRVYLAGGSEAYKRGEVMGMQLRDPLLSVMSEAYEREQVYEEAKEASAAARAAAEAGLLLPSRVSD